MMYKWVLLIQLVSTMPVGNAFDTGNPLLDNYLSIIMLFSTTAWTTLTTACEASRLVRNLRLPTMQ